MSDGFGYNQLQVVRLVVQVDRQGSPVILNMAVLPGELEKPRNGSRRPGLSPICIQHTGSTPKIQKLAAHLLKPAFNSYFLIS
jgi:hypothetical protein